MWIAENFEFILDKNELINRYSYIISDKNKPPNSGLETDQLIVGEVDRYGGSGIGKNGGSGRCAIINGVQIKGVGRTQLAVSDDDLWHSYGGLNLQDAIYGSVAVPSLGK